MEIIRNFIVNTVLPLEKKYAEKTGYIYVIISQLCFAYAGYLIKMTSGSVAPGQLLFFRFLILVSLNFPIVTSEKIPLYYPNPVINYKIGLRGILAFLAGLTWIYAAANLPLSEAIVLMMTNPVVTGILAAFLINEKYELMQFINSCICFMGVMLVMKPDFLFGPSTNRVNENESKMLGVIMALVNSFCSALNVVLIRNMGNTVPVFAHTHFFGFYGTLLAPTLMIMEGIKSITLANAHLVFLFGFFGYIAQFLLTRGVTFGKAARVSIMSYTQIIFGYILDIFFIGIVPSVTSVIGSICIASPIIFMVFFHKIQFIT